MQKNGSQAKTMKTLSSLEVSALLFISPNQTIACILQIRGKFTNGNEICPVILSKDNNGNITSDMFFY